MSFDSSKPPLIQETLLKKRRSLDELSLRRATTLSVRSRVNHFGAPHHITSHHIIPNHSTNTPRHITPHQQTQNKKKKNVRGEAIKLKRPEQFVREANIRQGSQNKMNRRRTQVAAKTKASLIPKDEKMKETVGFMVRIHMGRHASAEIKKQLRELGLNKKYDAAFVKLDREGIAKLRCIDAYVAYGYISSKNVVELVHRRAFIKDGAERKPLSDNMVVERLLGDKDILCLSDMSHEIFSVGSNFEAATALLCTFQLSAPVGAYEKKVLQVHDKVEDMGGFLGERMEQFLNKIL